MFKCFLKDHVTLKRHWSDAENSALPLEINEIIKIYAKCKAKWHLQKLY